MRAERGDEGGRRRGLDWSCRTAELPAQPAIHPAFGTGPRSPSRRRAVVTVPIRSAPSLVDPVAQALFGPDLILLDPPVRHAASACTHRLRSGRQRRAGGLPPGRLRLSGGQPRCGGRAWREKAARAVGLPRFAARADLRPTRQQLCSSPRSELTSINKTFVDELNLHRCIWLACAFQCWWS